MPNDRVSFGQMTPNLKNGQMTRSLPNTGLKRVQTDVQEVAPKMKELYELQTDMTIPQHQTQKETVSSSITLPPPIPQKNLHRFMKNSREKR
ncbi:hypothetical protein RclHR1_03460007 [Rhizophagus clarus]|uniref:Uncharacterized protein n=1 Tax=Rhizophagus clarus TaxID=94130 RepID=A0A2Z6S569_9GLOM|nr:hypothetical protein RclHR1_03460007 [Rhizophagus clarus]GES74504.1 hypothetical protein RCL_e15443_RclHR1_03460007 [Rhizophagus clarus]